MTPEDERKQRIQDYLICFSTDAGKRVLADMKKAYSDQSSFSTDALDMARKEGRREVYLKIRYLMDDARRAKTEEKQVKAETA